MELDPVHRLGRVASTRTWFPRRPTAFEVAARLYSGASGRNGLATMVRAGMTPLAALQTATVNPRAILVARRRSEPSRQADRPTSCCWTGTRSTISRTFAAFGPWSRPDDCWTGVRSISCSPRRGLPPSSSSHREVRSSPNPCRPPVSVYRSCRRPFTKHPSGVTFRPLQPASAAKARLPPCREEPRPQDESVPVRFVSTVR